MAIPVQPTPFLYGKDAENFAEKIQRDLNNPTRYVATPKLDRAKQKLAGHVSKNRQK